MTIKNLLMLGGVLAGAHLLRNKDRRDRLFGQVRDFIEGAKSRATDVANSTGSSTSEASRDGLGNSFESSSESRGFDGSGYGRTRGY